MNRRPPVASFYAVVFGAALLLGLLVSAALPLRAMPADICRVLPPSGAQPLAIVIKMDLPPEAHVCLDVATGLTPCRSVKEFREWVTRREGK